jgi:hypothetical protein
MPYWALLPFTKVASAFVSGTKGAAAEAGLAFIIWNGPEPETLYRLTRCGSGATPSIERRRERSGAVITSSCCNRYRSKGSRKVS